MPAQPQPALLRSLITGDTEQDWTDLVILGPEHVDETLAVEEVLRAGEDGDGEDADDVGCFRVNGGFGDELAYYLFGELVQEVE